jgi:hypothetical protein
MMSPLILFNAIRNLAAELPHVVIDVIGAFAPKEQRLAFSAGVEDIRQQVECKSYRRQMLYGYLETA